IRLIALTLLTAASLYLTWTLIALAYDVRALLNMKSRKKYISKPLESYSFVGKDHPKRMPVPEKLVKMTVEESAHSGITDPEAEEEWAWTATIGDGHVRIGGEKRMFPVAMFHQLHCLRRIRSTLVEGWGNIPEGRKRHMLHCFNYLRQWTLCDADVTLEKGDFAKRNFTTERRGATHTCIDWVPAYEYMPAEKWFEWEEFKRVNNIPEHDDVT
ncbi:hypothetical protein K443DRAFT_32177, partial [Laccaria amethystina LaAM-08-1]